jgi:tetratricopeptide (TPR) repeat protein
MRGLQLRELGRYQEAAGCFTEALAQNPRDDFALHQLAVCQLHLPKGKTTALATIEQAISIEPNDADHHVLRSFILCDLERSRDALKAARTALELDPHLPTAFSAEAQAHLLDSDWPEAERSARAALAIDPDFSVAANQLAHALRLQNKMDENAGQIAGMLARDPDDADTHTSAGWSTLQRGDHRGAATHFREALRLEPDHASAREGMLTAFRAKSPFYRGYLRWVFFMQRLGGGARWAMIIGLYLVAKLSRLIFSGPYQAIGIALTALYFLFVLWVWIADAVGNFLLLFDPFARIALRREEKIEAVTVGGGLVVGLAAVLAGIGSGQAALLLPGVAFIASVFPLAMIFTNEARLGAIASGVIAITVIGGGLLLGLSSMMPVIPAQPGMTLFIVGITGCLMVTWLGNFPFFRRRR